MFCKKLSKDTCFDIVSSSYGLLVETYLFYFGCQHLDRRRRLQKIQLYRLM